MRSFAGAAPARRPGGLGCSVAVDALRLRLRMPWDGWGWASSGLAGALGGTSAPRPAPPGAPGLSRADLASPWSRSPGHLPDRCCPGLARGLGWHARESCAAASRCVPARRETIKPAFFLGSTRIDLNNIFRIKLTDAHLFYTIQCSFVLHDTVFSFFPPPPCDFLSHLTS